MGLKSGLKIHVFVGKYRPIYIGIGIGGRPIISVSADTQKSRIGRPLVAEQ